MKYLVLYITLLFSAGAYCQNEVPTATGGEYVFESSQCISEEVRQLTIQRLIHNTDILKREGVIPENSGRSMSSFIWPVRQVSATPYNNYYGISNFVDHEPSSGNLQDYSCGERTYDLSSGYDHRGTDIFSWPFGWHMVNNDQVEIIAAADGVIIERLDGNIDTNCDFSNPNWNAVFLRHNDGTVTWYGHLKKGSLTSKSIGQSVVAGEYLGVMASSGSSTGPHLHFEVWEDDTYTNLLDPYEGPCNDLNSSSMWANQQNYREPTINHVMTNSAFPVFNQCPQPATINEKTVFLRGETVYFSAYFRDQLLNDLTELRIIQPNGSTWSDWTHTNNGNYNASWWTWFWNFPGNEPLGTWTFEVKFMGQTQTAEFIISNSLPVELANFRGAQRGKGVDLNWQTLSEVGNNYFSVQSSPNGRDFTSIGRVEGNNDRTTETDYSFTDPAPHTGLNYYRLQQFDFSGISTFSEIINVYFDDPEASELSVYPNPVSNGFLSVDNPSSINATKVSILSVSGRELLDEYELGLGNNTVPVSLKPGVYFLRFATEAGEEVKRIVVR
ncbi:MAG: peptidoglycan DD-metalloendopeptidase family protein [Lewinella sp.]